MLSTAPPGNDMRMGINEAGQHGLSRKIDLACIRARRCSHIGLGPHTDDLVAPDRDGFSFRKIGVDSQDAPTMEYRSYRVLGHGRRCKYDGKPGRSGAGHETAAADPLLCGPWNSAGSTRGGPAGGKKAGISTTTTRAT